MNATPAALALVLATATAGTAETRQVTLGPVGERRLGPQHFGVNVEFFRPGLFYGTLAEDDPRSRRAAFVAALTAAGIRSLRFPGGNAAYYHLSDDPTASMALAHAIGSWEYRDDNPPSNRFVSTEQILGFSAATGVGLIYELPMLFVVEDGVTRATVPSKFSAKAGNYDHDRIDAGAAAARRIVIRARELGARILAWELGNEEFAHMEPADYVRVCTGYIRAIREVDRETPIIPVAMRWAWEVLPPLLDLPELAPFGGAGVHYPFGNWPGPGGDQPALFVNADYRIERWLEAFRRGAGEHGLSVPIAVTETTTHRHKQWDPHRIVPSYAHALTYTWNWMTMLGAADCSAAVFHDLETPFFGILRYDVWYDSAERRFRWCEREPPARDTPDRLRFDDRYVLSPTALANGLLASLSGGLTVSLAVEPPEDGSFRIRAARHDDGRWVAVAVNRSTRTVELSIAGPPEAYLASVTTVTAPDLATCLPDELTVREEAGLFRDGAWRVEVPPLSVVRWTLAPAA